MNIIEEPSRKTPIIAETDVLVVGGGPAGLSASIAAAREGVKTMLIERYGCFGGVSICENCGCGWNWFRIRNSSEKHEWKHQYIRKCEK